MVTLIIVVAIVATTWYVACGASVPSTARSRRHDDERRLRLLEREPERVHTGDLERLMRAHELPEDEIRMVADKAHRQGIKPFTMWMWAKRFDVHTLTVVVAADLSHDELLGHLGNGTLPDLEELRVFAALNGLNTTHVARAGRTPRRVSPRAVPPAAFGSSVSARIRTEPVIHEPGTWPLAG